MRIAGSVSLKRFIKFNVVGILNTLVDFALFFLLNKLGVTPGVAQACSYTGGLVNSFLLNKSWTFKHNEQISAKQILLFVGVNVTSLGLSLIVLHLFISLLGWPVSISKILVTGFTMVINYAGYKKLVFSKR
ncbi:MAG TPA: GtrA family protein [Bacilli bacterium]